MREITAQMIDLFKIDKIGYEFMGYTFDTYDELTFHHLVVPRRNCEKIGIESTGYAFWNGAILTRTAHNYLHTIEQFDSEIFFALTSEMINENIKINLNIDDLKRIRDLLLYFEHEHMDEYTKKGDLIIKPEYIEKRISLK